MPKSALPTEVQHELKILEGKRARLSEDIKALTSRLDDLSKITSPDEDQKRDTQTFTVRRERYTAHVTEISERIRTIKPE